MDTRDADDGARSAEFLASSVGRMTAAVNSMGRIDAPGDDAFEAVFLRGLSKASGVRLPPYRPANSAGNGRTCSAHILAAAPRSRSGIGCVF
jgi:hypothetical protein